MRNDELFKELKKLLDTFDGVCRKYNLRYTLCGGSLLGAIRHNGFIPWDDDLDVAMMREDYDKLLSLPKSEFKEPYFLQTPETDPGYYKTFVKLRNSNTTEIPHKDAIFHYNHGVFLDIFPLDNVPDDNKTFNRMIKGLEVTKRTLHFAARVYGGTGTKGLDLKRKLFYYSIYPMVKTGIITPKKEFDKINKIVSAYKNKTTKKIGFIAFSGKEPRFIYNADYLAGTENHIFEGDEYPIPRHYDEILKHSYGDYMTPVKQKTEHGDTIVDLNHSYKEYMRTHEKELLTLYMVYLSQRKSK